VHDELGVGKVPDMLEHLRQHTQARCSACTSPTTDQLIQ
jgi:hypothetical protein